MNSKEINLRNDLKRGKRKELNPIDDKCSLSNEEFEKIIEHIQEQMREKVKILSRKINKPYIID